MADETITLKLVATDLASGNISKAIGNIDRLAKHGGIVGSVFQGVGQSFGQMLNPLGLAMRGFDIVTDIMGDATQAAMKEEESIALLTRAIEENVEAWDGNMEAVERVISAREDLAFADDEQRESLRQLVATTKDVNDALDLQATAMDLARLRNMDLGTASLVLGKVYAGNVGILSRYGIQLERGTSATEALAEIQRRAKGQAEAYAETTRGKLIRSQVALDNAMEELGFTLTPIVAELADAATDVLPKLAGAFGFVVDGIVDLMREAQKWDPNFLVNDAIVEKIEAYAEANDIAAASIPDVIRLTQQNAQAARDMGISNDDVLVSLDALIASGFTQWLESSAKAAETAESALRPLPLAFKTVGEAAKAGFDFDSWFKPTDFSVFEGLSAALSPKKMLADLNSELKAANKEVRKFLEDPETLERPMQHIQNKLGRLMKRLPKVIEVGGPAGELMTSFITKMGLKVGELETSLNDEFIALGGEAQGAFLTGGAMSVSEMRAMFPPSTSMTVLGRAMGILSGLGFTAGFNQTAKAVMPPLSGNGYNIGPGRREAPRPGGWDGSLETTWPRARGGWVSKDRTYRINERGEEFFTPGTNGYVHPAGGDTNIFNIGYARDAKSFAQEVGPELERWRRRVA